MPKIEVKEVIYTNRNVKVTFYAVVVVVVKHLPCRKEKVTLNH
jgi:hypothetical protein